MRGEKRGEGGGVVRGRSLVRVLCGVEGQRRSEGEWGGSGPFIAAASRGALSPGGGVGGQVRGPQDARLPGRPRPGAGTNRPYRHEKEPTRGTAVALSMIWVIPHAPSVLNRPDQGKPLIITPATPPLRPL